MYLEGLHNEGVLVDDNHESPVQPPSQPEFGKPVELGAQKVDMKRVTQRTVSLPSVNWGPPPEVSPQ